VLYSTRGRWGATVKKTQPELKTGYTVYSDRVIPTDTVFYTVTIINKKPIILADNFITRKPNTQTHTRTHLYTGCPRRNEQNFGRVFLKLKYTDITQNTYIQS